MLLLLRKFSSFLVINVLQRLDKELSHKVQILAFEVEDINQGVEQRGQSTKETANV